MIREELGEALKKYYRIYGVTSVQSRSLPDFFSGLKPIQKRILLVLSEYYKVGKFTKSMSISADTQKLFHPHGEISVYHALVNLVQPFHTRLPVIEPQGNWGSPDGDSPAAPRYTECAPRSSISIYTGDLKYPCVPMVSNYSGELLEPSFLPTKLPMLMINGSQGIAVGFACSFLPHNPLEVYNLMVALLHQGDSIRVSDYLLGPDFPTGGTIINPEREVKEILDTGVGSYKVRGDYWVEDKGNFSYIHFTSTPYRYARGDITRKIKELVIAKELSEVLSIYDSSGQNGIDLVIKVKRHLLQETLRKLFHMTDLRVSMSVNQFCLVNGKPEKLNLKQIAEKFIVERSRIVVLRTQNLIVNNQRECNILRVKILASLCLEEIVRIIRLDEEVELRLINLKVDEDKVKELTTNPKVSSFLTKNERFSKEDVEIILKMTIGQLRKVSMERALSDVNEKLTFIEECRKILNYKQELLRVIEKDMFEEISRLNNDVLERRTTIQFEDSSKVQESVLIMYSNGTIKRIANEEIIDQNKGGMGKSNLIKQNLDITLAAFLKQDMIIFFTNKGYAYKVRLTGFNWEEDSYTSILELLNLRFENEIIVAVMEYSQDLNHVVLVTSYLKIKKVSLTGIFSKVSVRKVINLRKEEELTDAKPCQETQEILIVNNDFGLKMSLDKLRTSSLTSGGVLGIKSTEKVGWPKLITTLRFILVGENGFGGIQLLSNYRLQKRGGMGVSLGYRKRRVLLNNLYQDDYILLVTNQNVIKISLSQLKESNKKRKGIKLIRLPKDHHLRFICPL